MNPDPTDEELVVFAADLLGEVGEHLGGDDGLAQSVHEARDLWLMLYRLTQSHG